MRDPISAVDQIIHEAQQEGKFEELRGKGKPLVIDTSPDAVIKGILKEANVSITPEWITLAGEIDRRLEQEQSLLQDYAAVAEAEQPALLATIGKAETSANASARSTAGVFRRPRWRVLVAVAPRRRDGVTAAPPADELALAAFQRRWDQTLERYAALLHTLNGKIRRFNDIVPLAHRQQALLPVRERLDAFTERFPRLARAADGTLHPARGHVPASLLIPPSEATDEALPMRDLLQAVALLRMTPRGHKPPPPIG